MFHLFALWIGLAVGAPTLEDALVGVSAKAQPAVVYVEVSQGVGWSPVLLDLLHRFDLQPPPRRHRGERATGSAFFITPEGRALTNHHVVAGATTVTLVLSDQRRYLADVVGSDPRTDLAVLQVRADRTFPWLPLGDSDRVRVGQIVLAVGNPYDFASTATMGIVSFIGRRGLDAREIQDYIQTDAPVHPGNSGGPLLSLRGEVVGINTAIYARGVDSGSGISFAIPSNMAKRTSEEVLRDGRARRPRIGLRAEDVEEVEGDASMRGAVVTWVVPGSPASAAGLRRGDVIVRAHGEPVVGAAALRSLVRARPVGEGMELDVVRGQQRLRPRVELVDEQTLALGQADRTEGDHVYAGMVLGTADEEVRRALGVGPAEGVLVRAVTPGSTAAKMGVLAGDRVVSVAGRSVEELQELVEYLEIVQDAPVVVGLRRGAELRRTILLGEP
ncbi:MAG: PDZ domain-containing protein [Deltaproteobacteria bacterium]|nr:MAG: PDZ domain-containing protein [Deltaproteobacteria bacterium]